MSANFFTYDKEGDFVDYVNAEIRRDVFSEYYRFRHEGRQAINDVVLEVQWILEMQEHYASDDFYSLNTYKFWDYGGAHPNRGISTMNFDESAGGRLEIGQLFGFNRAVLHYIREAVELDVRHQTFIEDGEHSNYSLEHYVGDDLIDGWKVFSRWNASPDGLTIYLSQCSELPFVMGVFKAKLPWTFLKTRVAEEFQGSYIHSLIMGETDNNAI